MRFPGLLCAVVALFAAGCSSEKNVTAFEEFELREIRFPNGKTIRAEVMMTPEDMSRGMMFRDPLPPGRGMLFIHENPGQYSYWMYQVRVPLDIIWMDASRRIVEISAATPACPGPNCPSYGGHQTSRYVLELNGGEAQRQGLRVGDLLTF